MTVKYDRYVLANKGENTAYKTLEEVRKEYLSLGDRILAESPTFLIISARDHRDIWCIYVYKCE